MQRIHSRYLMHDAIEHVALRMRHEHVFRVAILVIQASTNLNTTTLLSVDRCGLDLLANTNPRTTGS